MLLLSGVFRNNQAFFRWYGDIHRKMLRCVTHFFVQNEHSQSLLRSIGVNNVTVSGDTRFDRVIEIAEKAGAIPCIDEFCGTHPVIVAGSTWQEDEEELEHFANTHSEIRFIIAPHEVEEARIAEVEKLFKRCVRYSRMVRGEWSAITTHHSLLFVFLESGLINLVVSNLVGNAPAREAAELGTFADVTACLAQSLAQIPFLERRG